MEPRAGLVMYHPRCVAPHDRRNDYMFFVLSVDIMFSLLIHFVLKSKIEIGICLHSVGTMDDWK